MKNILLSAVILIALQGCGGGKSDEPSESGHLIITLPPAAATKPTTTQVSVIGAPVIMIPPKPTTTTTASTTTTTSIPTTTTTTVVAIAPAALTAPLRLVRDGDTWEYAAVVSNLATQETEEGRLTTRIAGKISNAAGVPCWVEEITGALTSTSTAIQRHIKDAVYFAQDDTGARLDCGFRLTQEKSIFIRYANLNVDPRLPFRRIEAVDGFGGSIGSPIIPGSAQNWLIYYWDFEKGASYQAREINISVSAEKTAVVPLGSFSGWEIDTTIAINGSDAISEHVVDFIVPEIGVISQEKTVYSDTGEISATWDYKLESFTLYPLGL